MDFFYSVLKNECNNNEKVLNAKLNDYIQLTNDLRNQLTESLSKTKEQKYKYFFLLYFSLYIYIYIK